MYKLLICLGVLVSLGLVIWILIKQRDCCKSSTKPLVGGTDPVSQKCVNDCRANVNSHGDPTKCGFPPEQCCLINCIGSPKPSPPGPCDAECRTKCTSECIKNPYAHGGGNCTMGPPEQCCMMNCMESA